MRQTDPTSYSPPRLDTVLYVTGDIIFATAVTFANVTGLTLALQSTKTYIFEARIFHISALTTTGAQFAVNIGAVPTTLIVGNYSGVTNAVVTGIISLGTTALRDTAVTAQTTGSAGITMTILSGMIQPSADGTFAIRATAEVSANMTVKKGSWLWVRECEN